MARHEILCFGDSNTAGYHSFGLAFEPYGDSLAQALAAMGRDCKVRHVGMSGITAHAMLTKKSDPSFVDILGKWHKGFVHHLTPKPDLVIIMTGTNDLTKGYSAEDILRFTVALHETCHALGIYTVAIAPLTYTYGTVRQTRNRLAALLQQWAASNRGQVLYFADVEKVVPKGSPRLWEWDDLHFSAAGSQQLGRQLAGDLVAALVEREEEEVSSLGFHEDLQPSWLDNMLGAVLGY
mmetsp:Transcript_67336/g.161442  ORF Transcript_67336/g.161442 Transcript_67336/m.161442 type:complete len:237 (+) Transcript_67336:123-833(+)